MATPVWRMALDGLPEYLLSSRAKGEICAAILVKKVFTGQDVDQAVLLCGSNQEALMGVFKALLPVSPLALAVPQNKKEQAPHNKKEQDMMQKKKPTSELWSGTLTSTLLELYEDTWCTITNGNFSRRHWSRIADALNGRCDTTFKAFQCKNRWDSLRRAFQKAKALEKKTGIPSAWPFYEQCNRILGKSLKIEGVKDAFNGEDFTPIPDAEDVFEDSAVSEMATTPDHTMNYQPVVSSAEYVDGKRVRKKRKLSIGSIGDKVEKAMSKFAETIKEIEQARMAEETRRLDKVMEVQLQIAQILAKPSNYTEGGS